MPPKKDPLKPKGRTSAYAFFVQEKKEYNKANGINLDFTGFSQCCSEDWKKLSQEKKKKYFDLAEVDKARYDREMKEYVPPTEEGKRRKKKQKDKNAPKRGMSGFMFFSQEKRPKIMKENPGASVGDIAKKLGGLWSMMTPDQKAPYEDQAKADRERYEKEMKEYRKSGGGGAAAGTGSKQQGKKVPQKRGRKPKKPVVEEVEEDEEEDDEEEEEEESSSE